MQTLPHRFKLVTYFLKEENNCCFLLSLFLLNKTIYSCFYIVIVVLFLLLFFNRKKNNWQLKVLLQTQVDKLLTFHQLQCIAWHSFCTSYYYRVLLIAFVIIIAFDIAILIYIFIAFARHSICPSYVSLFCSSTGVLVNKYFS